MAFYDDFLTTVRHDYPETASSLDLTERLSANLISPHVVELPISYLSEAQKIAAAFFELRQDSERKKRLAALPPALPEPRNYSALMSFDFHIDHNARLKLIEINTNASMSLITDLVYRTRGLPIGTGDDFRKDIVSTFRAEYRETAGSGAAPLQQVAIVDERPTEQRLYIEFEFYRELFAQNGIEAIITDPQGLSFADGRLRIGDKVIDLVYNRDTDFYLESPATAALRAAMLAQTSCLTPNPFEYRLLADKDRLEELSVGELAAAPLSAGAKSAIEQCLIRTQAVADFLDKDALWADRKRWFFKPKRSFGGKAVYRGTSTSRGTFAQIISGDYLAQEYVPPAVFRAPTGSGSDEFKYDLRFFVYRDRVQLACARLYKGQMTNSRTPGGGVAAIRWS